MNSNYINLNLKMSNNNLFIPLNHNESITSLNENNNSFCCHKIKLKNHQLIKECSLLNEEKLKLEEEILRLNENYDKLKEELNEKNNNLQNIISENEILYENKSIKFIIRKK